jgi:hypothetical protein
MMLTPSAPAPVPGRVVQTHKYMSLDWTSVPGDVSLDSVAALVDAKTGPLTAILNRILKMGAAFRIEPLVYLACDSVSRARPKTCNASLAYSCIMSSPQVTLRGRCTYGPEGHVSAVTLCLPVSLSSCLSGLVWSGWSVLVWSGLVLPCPALAPCIVLSCPVLCCHVLSCTVLFSLVLSHLVLSSLILSRRVSSPLVSSRLVSSRLVCSCLALPCLVRSCPVLSCPVLSCPVLSFPVLSCLVLSCLVLSCLVLSVRPSVRPFVRPSVHPSVRPSACPSVCLWVSRSRVGPTRGPTRQGAFVCSVRSGPVRSGLVWSGLVWSGLVWSVYLFVSTSRCRSRWLPSSAARLFGRLPYRFRARGAPMTRRAPKPRRLRRSKRRLTLSPAPQAPSSFVPL